MKDLEKLRYHQLNTQVVEQQNILKNRAIFCSCFKELFSLLLKAVVCSIFILSLAAVIIIILCLNESKSEKLNNAVVPIHSGHNEIKNGIIKDKKIENFEKKRTIMNSDQRNPTKESDENFEGIAIGHFVDNLFNPKNEDSKEDEFDDKRETNKPESEDSENMETTKAPSVTNEIANESLMDKLDIVENLVQCNDIVPGINRMARGVDITTLDLFPSNLLQNNGFGSKLFEFTCQKARRWTHPTTKNQYTLPDQIATINTLPAGSMSIKTKFNRNLFEYRQSLAIQVGLDISDGLGGCFSQSVCYKEAKERILKYNQSISEASAYISDIQIDFQPSEDMQMSQQFRNYIEKKLPKKYESGVDVYNKFIETFGTHYFERAHFGGYLQQKTLIENEYLYKIDQRYLSESIKSKIMPLLSKNKTKRSIDSKFDSNCETFTHFYGGVADLSKQYKDDGFVSKWIESVFQDPWLFTGKLVPIENLIKNQTIKREMQKAISVHRVNAHLKDFKNALVLAKVKLAEKGISILNSIVSYLKNPKSEQAVNKCSKIIDKMFVSVQQLKDRELLKEYHTKLDRFYDITFSCKYGIAKWCKTSPMKEELQYQHDEFNQLFGKIAKFLKQDEPPNSKEVLELVQEATKMIHYHETTVVDLCQKENAECQKCLEWTADCYYSEEKDPSKMTCQTQTTWNIIQYVPKKRNIIYDDNGERSCH